MKHPRRVTAAQRWRLVAAGTMDADTREWLAGVARDVLAADALVDGRREALARAVGLPGAVYPDQLAVHLVVEHVNGLPDSQFGAGRAGASARKAMLRSIVRAMLATVDGPCTLNDEAIDARIRRARRG